MLLYPVSLYLVDISGWVLGELIDWMDWLCCVVSVQLTTPFHNVQADLLTHESPRAVRLHSSDLRYEDQNRGQTGNSWENMESKDIGAGRSIINPPGKRTKDQREREGTSWQARQGQARAWQERTISSLAITTGPSLPCPSNPLPLLPLAAPTFGLSISDSAHPCPFPVHAYPCPGGFPVRVEARPGSGQLQPLAAAPQMPPCRPHASLLLNEEGTGEKATEVNWRGREGAGLVIKQECPFNNKSSSYSINQSTPVSLGTHLELLKSKGKHGNRNKR